MAINIWLPMQSFDLQWALIGNNSFRLFSTLFGNQETGTRIESYADEELAIARKIAALSQ
jgi:hypothetical protein